MKLLEILLIVGCALLVAGVIVAAVVGKKRGKSGCGCCADCAHCQSCSRGALKTENSDGDSQEANGESFDCVGRSCDAR